MYSYCTLIHLIGIIVIIINSSLQQLRSQCNFSQIATFLKRMSLLHPNNKAVQKCGDLTKVLGDGIINGAIDTFREILLLHSKNRRWHYGIQLRDDHTSSLAHLLNLTNSELDVLLVMMGFATATKNNKISVRKPAKILNLVRKYGEINFELHLQLKN